MAFTAARPAAKVVTMAAVISCGHGVTPLATTPWSPAKTATAAGSGIGGGQAPAAPGPRGPPPPAPPRGPGRIATRARWVGAFPSAPGAYIEDALPSFEA